MNTNSELYKEWEKSITTLYFYISKQNSGKEKNTNGGSVITVITE